MDRNSLLAILGIILGVIGVSGTYFQILGERFIWIGLITIGVILISYYVFNLSREIRTVVKTFGTRWQIVDGRLRIGSTINVALRAKALQELLQIFEKELRDDEIFSRTVKEAGMAIGSGFATDLRAELKSHGIDEITSSGRSSAIIINRLSLWAKYDSTTGMGGFDVDNIVFMDGKLSGYILLKNSFLAYDRQSNIPVCRLIEGYIEGFINYLLEMRVQVTETQCSAITGEGTCRFDIEALPGNSESHTT